MTPTIATALTGFFVFSGVHGLSAESLRKPEAPEVPIYQTYTVAMTGYNALPEQTDSDPFTTASGAYSDPDVMAARSVDLADELPFGTVIAVSGSETTPNCGIGLVEDQILLRVIGDSMHPRKRQQIDILFDHTNTVLARGKQMNPALVLGMCKNIEISVVGFVDIKRIPKTQAELRKAINLTHETIGKPIALGK
jgi:3D (Asp-Asp-Asp) domain-containing protein